MFYSKLKQSAEWGFVPHNSQPNQPAGLSKALPAHQKVPQECFIPSGAGESLYGRPPLCANVQFDKMCYQLNPCHISLQNSMYILHSLCETCKIKMPNTIKLDTVNGDKLTVTQTNAKPQEMQRVHKGGHKFKSLKQVNHWRIRSNHGIPAPLLHISASLCQASGLSPERHLQHPSTVDSHHWQGSIAYLGLSVNRWAAECLWRCCGSLGQFLHRPCHRVPSRVTPSQQDGASSSCHMLHLPSAFARPSEISDFQTSI